MQLKRSNRAAIFALTAAAFVTACSSSSDAAQTTIEVFKNAGIQFGGDSNWNSQRGVTIHDNGRIIERVITSRNLAPFPK